MKFSLRLFSLLAFALSLTQPSASGQSYRWIKPLAPVRRGADTLQTPKVYRLTLDAAGNTYSFGFVKGDHVVDGVRYNSADGRRRQVLTKYAPNGSVAWHQALGLSDSLVFRAATVDAAGNLRAVGLLRGRTRVGSQVVVSQPNRLRIVVAEWSATGLLRWVRAGDDADAEVNGAQITEDIRMKFDGSGGVLMTGPYEGRPRIGSVKLPNLRSDSLTSQNGFCARFDSAGRLQWVKALLNEDTAPSASFMAVRGVGTDLVGNVYFIGTATRATLDGHPLIPAAMPYGAFWVKVSPTGQFLRSRAIKKDDFGYGLLAVDDDGFSYIADEFDSLNGPVDVGGITYSSNSYDGYVLRLDPDGVLQWSQHLRMKNNQGSQVVPTGLGLDAHGTLYLSGDGINDTLLIGPFQLPPASVNGFVAAFDAITGQAEWLAPVTGPFEDLVEQMAVGQNGQVAIAGLSQSDSTWFGRQLLYTSPDSSEGKNFVALLSSRYNTIQGAVYVDANANGARDAGESGPPFGAVVEVTPGPLAFGANRAGTYVATVDAGTFTTTLPNPPPYHTVAASGPATATFSTYGNVAAGPTFALLPIPNQQDVQVILTQVSAARPGWPATYHAQYRNVGTVPISSGLLTLTPDSRLTYVSSAPAATVSGGSILWAYANLLPGETRHVRAIFTLAATAVVGTTLSSTATLTPLAGDLVPADNTSAAARVVTGSFDPNDITVNHTTLNTTQTAAGEWLEYTVRFQNHGTDTAFTVLVIDSLPANLLRLNTLLPLAGSHSFGWSVSPAGQLLIRFTGIKLPPQATNLLDSEGFVRFHVRPAASLAAGDEIPNAARIHFDFNAPMATNTALTRIQGTTGRVENDGGAGIRVWPNPAGAGASLRVSGVALAAGLMLADLCGRTVATATARATGEAEIATAGLAAGVYVLRGVGTGAPWARRVVVR